MRRKGVGTAGWWIDEIPHGPLFYLVGDCKGRFDSLALENLPKERAEKLKLGVEYAVAADTPGRWTAEWKIPLAPMCIDPNQTDFCHFNIGVSKPGTRSDDGQELKDSNHRWSVWSGTGGPNWQVWNAGKLILKP